MAAGRGAGIPARVLRARPARLPHLPSRPPIPKRVVEPGGQTLFTRDNIMDGQETFLREGLMEYGSIFGAYLGPDFTADYLRRAALSVRDSYGGAARRTGRFSARSPTSGATATTRAPAPSRTPGRRRRRSESSSPTIAPTSATRRPSSGCAQRDRRPRRDPQADRLLQLGGLGDLGRAPGPQLLVHEQLAPEPLVDNKPTANVVVWSVISLIALLGGVGLLFARAFGRWNSSAGTGASSRLCRSAHRATSPSPPRNAPAPGSCS